MGKSTFIEELETACQKSNVTAAELVEYVIEAKEGHRSSRRAVLGLAGALGVGLAATGIASASTSQGQVSANSGQYAKIEGPSDTTVIDLSSDICDLQNTNRMVLPLYAGTNPSTVVGDFYYDTTSD